MRTAGSVAPDKTNERPGTRAQVRYARMSAWKARAVLDLIRGQTIARSAEILQYTDRGAADVVGKCLASAVANAVNNDGETPEELHVAACYADEGPTLRRWRPRARGRATRIRKRTCHITIIVAPLPQDVLDELREREAARAASRRGRGASSAEARRRRVERSRAAQAQGPDEGEEQLDETVGDAAAELSDTDTDTSDVAVEARADADLDTGDDAGAATEDADADGADAPDGGTEAVRGTEDAAEPVAATADDADAAGHGDEDHEAGAAASATHEDQDDDADGPGGADASDEGEDTR